MGERATFTLDFPYSRNLKRVNESSNFESGSKKRRRFGTCSYNYDTLLLTNKLQYSPLRVSSGQCLPLLHSSPVNAKIPMMKEDERTVTWDHKETPDLSFISQGPKLTPKFYLMVSTPTVEKQKTKISKPTVASLTKFYSALAIKYANFAQFMDLLKPFLDYREAKQICDLVNCLVAPAVFCEWDQIEVEKFHNLVGRKIRKIIESCSAFDDERSKLINLLEKIHSSTSENNW